MWSIPADHFLMTLQFMHRREEGESLPFVTVLLILQQSDDPWSFPNVGLDVKKRPETIDVAIKVHSRDMRRVQGSTVVDADGLDTAAMRGRFEKRNNLLRSVESVVIPGKGKLVTPARAW